MQLNIHPDNTASKKVAEKCGFSFEGIMRGCSFQHSEYHDLEVWTLIRDETSKLRNLQLPDTLDHMFRPLQRD